MTTALLIELAWKSTLTLGATLLLLRLLRHRSAAERSWLAHAGLLFTLLLPLAHVAMPRWNVEAPAPVAEVLAPVTTTAGASTPDTVVATSPATIGETPVTVSIATTPEPAAAPLLPIFEWIDTALLIYGLPAALLLGITLIAVVRLFGLRHRANVLIENSWLSALARAQHRMDFKYGTALLVSSDIGSPVSWGVLRPVILLNTEALESREQAEAVIAHELAHVANLDWAKLLLARITAAVFWFNPLVWVLTKQCHQLREEAADDAVLSHDVPDLDYAELLVGVARHESGALLLAANGVAPSRGSLAQRVTRVLDTSLRRAPARFGWTAGITAGALIFAAPLAALSLGAAGGEAPGERLQMAALQPPAIPAPAAAPQPLAAPAQPVAPTAMAAAITQAVAVAVPQQLANAVDTDIDVDVDVDVDLDLDEPSHMTFRSGGKAPWKVGSVVPLPRVEALALNGGGEVILRHGARSQVRFLGGNPAAAKLNVSNDNLSISGGANGLKLELTVPSIEAISIRGGGVVVARGEFPPTRDLAIAVHGGGVVETDAIKAHEVAAAIRGGGEIRTRVEHELAASVTGGGDINYRGDPREVARAIEGGGTINRVGN
ncbi:M56 family metallopeptidase [Sphingoaurantiacus capsulatus]|uniref:M56 family metallopeptidase n=1 Tax=Sphingoaurantiacus capsulatus TaxID=1771310 RepID=A0ABV7X7L7_9SPHN